MSETVSARGIDLNSTATKDTVLGLEAARDLDAVDSVVPPEANNRLMRRLNTLLNTVELAVAETYDRAR